MKLKYIVYITINLCNGKFYIGVHKTNPEVFDGYIGCGIYRKSCIKPKLKGLHAAVKKYGYENFKRTTLKVFPHTKQGELDAYAFEKELVNSTLLKSKSVYNLTTGGKGGAGFPKEVYKFTLTGKFLQKFNSITEAAETIDSNNLFSVRKAISNNCSKVVNTAYGFVWNYEKKFIPVTNKCKRKISQYTLGGKYIRSYDSIAEAEVELQCNSIYQAITKQYQCIGYQWRYDNGTTDDIEPLTNVFNDPKCILMYDAKLKLIKKFTNVREIPLEYSQLSVSQINRVLKGIIRSHKGYVFKYSK